MKRNEAAGADNLPGGSMGWPILGETIGYLKPHKSNTIGTFLEQHCWRYGKVFKSHVFGSPTIISCSLELSTFVLQNEGRLFESSYPKPVKNIVGHRSLMIVHGELHKKLRSVEVDFINSFKSSRHFAGHIQNLSSSLMESWKGKQQIHLFQEAKAFSFNVMLKCLFDMAPGDPLAIKLFQDFLTFMEGFVSLPLNLPGTTFAKAMKARRRVASTFKDILNEKGKRKSEEWGNDNEDSFADSIVGNDCLKEEEKVSVLFDLLLAGYETTSGLIALTAYFLAQTPLALQQLKEEHQALRRRKNGEALTWEDYKQMQFTPMVINETLRCGNLVKFVHRKAIKDVEFKGYRIPAGWKVLPILSAVNLDPSLHKNPHQFNPWRWNDPGVSKNVIPFGGGIRICPGAEIGKLEVSILLHYLVQSFRWETKKDDHPFSYPYLAFKRGLVLDIEHIQLEGNDN
ncbi:cytochrome P450 724B1-like [Ipomoea triloba]|uniref:cytochrome P450 724B1-like n=1 Tax=Ipomoea triloba TaxID=35885 RepID=UPI00125E63B3|nr:cytochrome P450 724B1-like [Ipomoea triloba]